MDLSKVFLVFSAIVAVGLPFPGIQDVSEEEAVDYYAYPRYHFRYGVNSFHTGDIKSASEERDGGVVRGEYSVVEPDGGIRTVRYVADPTHGFNAVVSRTPPAAHHRLHPSF